MKRLTCGIRSALAAGTLRALLILSASPAPEGCLALDLVADGRAAAKVVVPDEANPVTGLAADLLVRYVAEITGVRLETLREKDAGATAEARVYLGATEKARTAGVDVSKLRDDGFVWKAVGRDLVIAGRDVPFASAKGATGLRTACHGTARGVYRLLEDYGGVRWFLPTPKGVVVPKSERFSVPDALSRREEPPFAYTAGGVAGAGEWSLANGQRLAADVRITGHSWDGALRDRGDPKQLFEKDPSLFAQVNGKRVYSDSNFQLCPSHPGFIEMNVTHFSKLFDAGYQWAEYNQSDGWCRCECDACDAQDRLDELKPTWGEYWNREPDPSNTALAPAERLWLPFREIAARLNAKYPDRKIVVLAYGPTFIPSQKVTRFPPNVMIALCREYDAHFDFYAGFDKTVWTYWWGDYHVSGYTPCMMPHEVAGRLRRLVDRGVRGVFVCGGGEQWGLEGPAYYAYAKLSWNPGLDVDTLVDDYCRGVFHSAATEMRQFFNLIEARIRIGQNTQTVKERAENECNIAAANYFPEAYPPAVLSALDSLLAQAKGKTGGDEFARQWLALTELQYRYLRIVATAFTLYREYRYSRQKPLALCRELAAAVEERTRYFNELEKVKADPRWTGDWFPGSGVFMGGVRTGGSMFGALNNRPPFSEAFAKELAAASSPK